MTPHAPSRYSWLTRERLMLAGLLLFTAVVRGGVLWGMRENLKQDPDAYREIAENVLAHGVYGLGQSVEPGYDPFATTPLRPTAYRPPLYPILLSNLPAADGKHISLVKVAIVHVLLGVGTAWLTFLAARRILRRVGQASAASADPRGIDPTTAADPISDNGQSNPRGSSLRLTHPTIAATLAALLVACDPILLNQQTLVMTETLATFLAVLALWCLARFHDHRYWWNAGLAGGAIGLAVLCRPTFLPWLGLVGVAMLISDFRFQISDWRMRLGRNLANLVALAMVAAAVMSPWPIRNQQEFRKPILTTTHGGYTLWLGNNPSFFDWLRHDKSGLPWDVKQDRTGEQIHDNTVIRLDVFVELVETKTTDLPTEMFNDRVDARIASQAIQDDPAGFALACFYRIRQLWSPLPNKLTADESQKRTLLRYATAAWYCGVYFFAAVGVWRLRWRLLNSPWLWGVLLCLTFTAVHTFYWSNLRMRAPLMPFVALVAAAAIVPQRADATNLESNRAVA